MWVRNLGGPKITARIAVYISSQRHMGVTFYFFYSRSRVSLPCETLKNAESCLY